MTNGINGIGAANTAAALNAAEEEIEVLEEQVEEANDNEEAEQVMANTGMTKEDLKERIEDLETQRKVLLAKMDKLEENIKVHQEKAVQEIMEADELKEHAIEEYEDDARIALTKCIEDYTRANKKEPGSMSRDELAGNIEKSMPNSPNLAKAMAKYVHANAELDIVDELLVELNNTAGETEFVELELLRLKEQTPTPEAKEKQEDTKPKCTDPVGFTQGDVKYDFVVDDGNFDSASDFLGADNGWDAVTALDSISKDGKVTADELAANNIKFVKTYTDENGNKVQELVDPAKEFDSFEIDLNSYKEGGEHSAIDTGADFDNDGVADQQLLGTFDIKINGQSVSGYNTMDDVDYLNKEYGFAGEAGEATGTGETNPVDARLSEELKGHFNFFTEYTQKSQEARADIEEGLAELGLDETTVEMIKAATKTQAKNEADTIIRDINAEVDKEAKTIAEEAKKAKEAEEAEEADKEAKGLNKEELEERIDELEENGEEGELTIAEQNKLNDAEEIAADKEKAEDEEEKVEE